MAQIDPTWITLLCGIALLVAVSSSFWQSRKRNELLLQLNDAAKAIAQGDFDRRVVLQGTREIRELAQSFNDMASQLKLFFTAYQQSEKKFAKLLESLPIGVLAIDASGAMIYLNLTGLEILGQDASDTSTPENRPAVFQPYIAGTDHPYPSDLLPSARALRGEAVLVDDIEIHCENGVIVPLEVRSIPVFDEAGQILYAINVFQDITHRRQAEQILANYNWTLAAQVAARTEDLAQANAALEQEIVERKQIEQALRESEGKFRAVFNQRLQLVSLLKPDGTVLEANQTALDFSGLRRSQVIGQFFWDTRWWSLSTNIQAQLQQAIARAAQGESIRYEVEVLGQGNHIATLDFFLHPIWNEAGQVWLLLSEGQDISERKREEAERKRAEEALKISERNLRAVFNSAYDAIFIHAADGTILKVNDRLLELYQVSREQALQLSIEADYFAATQPPNLLPAAWNRALQGETVCFEIQAKRPNDGLIFDVEVALCRIVFNSKAAVLAIVRDISDRKQAAAALEAQRALLYTVIDAVPSCIFVKDPEGRMTAVNQAGADLHGATVEEIIGNRETDFSNVSAAQLEEFLAVNREVMASRQPQTCPAQAIRNRQGELRWYQTTISPLIDSAGQVQGIIGASTDITNLKQVEEELRQAKNAAEAANKAKGAFLANMSHELRTPLNAILGFSQLMAHDALTSQQRKQLETINRNGEHLLQLINEVLSIAKIESGHVSLEEAPCNLYLLLESVEGMFSLRASSKNIRLLCERAADVPQVVEVDSRKLRQILTNLIDNAIKFTEQGQVVLRVGVRQTLDNEPRLHFEVADTGLGIAANELNLIFESFIQSEAGRRSQQGTGLGLPLCRRFVQLMGGDLHVSSELGRGSVFWFTIPLKLTAEAVQAIAPPPVHPISDLLNPVELQIMPAAW
ncbi:MAG TPA: PAS domain S-box protein, partial [Coleofasciculaceae cyanobacterium]